MKYWFAILACILLVVNALSKDISYKVNGTTLEFSVINDNDSVRTCMLSKAYNVSGDIRIPSKIFDYDVVSIGPSVFDNCTGLTSVTIPNSVTEIWEFAFSGCSGLTSVTIPPSVDTIGAKVFSWCSSINEIKIEDSSRVLSVDKTIFDDCPISTLYIGRDLRIDSSSSPRFPTFNQNTLKNVSFGEHVTIIPDYAFDHCTNLSSVLFSKSITSIGAFAFRECTRLNSLMIPSSITDIGEGAFYKCWGLTKISIPNSVKNIGIEAFYDCYHLGSITIPESVTTIGRNAFYINVDPSPEVYFNAENCETCGDKNGSAFHWSLQKVHIGDSVKTIPNFAFMGCSLLNSIDLPNSVTSIGSHAFDGCYNLRAINLPDSICNIGSYAFQGCSNLTSISIPNSVKSIDSYSFYDTGLIEVFFNAENCENLMGKGSIFPSTLKYIYFGKDVKSIPAYSFDGCVNLSSIDIPNTINYIGTHAFSGCTGLTSISIPNTIDSIESYLFSGCTRLSSIDIPSSITSIGEYAFHKCTGLISISLPSSITTLGRYAFYGCTGLTSMTIPNSVTTIGNHAFYGCTGLTSMVIPDSVTSIESYAFYGCTGLTSMTIPNSVTAVEMAVFRDCTGLASVIIPNSVTTIEAIAFSGCTGLTSITIPNSVIMIESGAFENCKNLMSIIIPNSVTTIKGNVFKGCDELSVVYFNAENCLTCGDYSYGSAFPKTLQNVYLGDNVKRIPDYLFNGLHRLTTISIPNSVTEIGSSAFDECSGLSQITIPDAVTTIGEGAFEKCTELKSVEIGTAVTKIGYSAFRGCENLTEIYFNAENCEDRIDFPPSLQKVYIGNKVKCIRNYLFSDCNNLTVYFNAENCESSDYAFPKTLQNVYFGDNIKIIPDNAFRYCSELTSIDIPGSVTILGKYAFDGCINLKSITYHSTDPILCSDNTFSETTYTQADLYIPSIGIDKAKIRVPWKNFKNIKEIINDKIEIKLNEEEIFLSCGGSRKLEVIVIPANLIVRWSSSDNSIVTIDNDGIIRAIATGTAIIRVYSESNPEIYAECRVTVKEYAVAVESVAVNPSEWTAAIGDEINLEVAIFPEDATDKSLVWESFDSEVATVDETGHVTAVGAGETVISLSVENNPEIFAECRVIVNEHTEMRELVWDQIFRCAVGDTVELTAYSSKGLALNYTSIKPDGGYCMADIYDEDGKNFATFNYEGAYVLEVSDGINSIEKRFNVVSTHENLMYDNGLYYRYINDDQSNLMVVRGYEMYEGDYTIPAMVNRLPVVSIDNFAFYSCVSLNDVVIEDGIKTIGTQAFGNGTLRSIIIPASIRDLGGYVFNALRRDLMSVSLYGLTPPYADETTFNGFVDYEKCVLHIPEGTKEVYREAPIWQNFVNIIDDLPRITSVKIQGGDRSMTIGDSETLSITLIPADVDDEIFWESSDPTIVSIDESGTITALAEGVAEITATVGDVSDTITVTVRLFTSVECLNYDNISVTTHNHEIILKGLPTGGIVNLINVDGLIMRNIIADSTEVRIPVGPKGIYIIQVGNRTFKIII